MNLLTTGQYLFTRLTEVLENFQGVFKKPVHGHVWEWFYLASFQHIQNASGRIVYFLHFFSVLLKLLSKIDSVDSVHGNKTAQPSHPMEHLGFYWDSRLFMVLDSVAFWVLILTSLDPRQVACNPWLLSFTETFASQRNCRKSPHVSVDL